MEGVYINILHINMYYHHTTDIVFKYINVVTTAVV